jgi:hypothetical protein
MRARQCNENPRLACLNADRADIVNLHGLPEPSPPSGPSAGFLCLHQGTSRSSLPRNRAILSGTYTMPLVAHPSFRRRPTVLARFRRFVRRLSPYQSLILPVVPAAVVEPHRSKTVIGPPLSFRAAVVLPPRSMSNFLSGHLLRSRPK